MQEEANAPSRTGPIGQVTTIRAMHTGGPAPTQRTAGILLGGNDRQYDLLIGDIETSHLQSFWQAQEGFSLHQRFHHPSPSLFSLEHVFELFYSLRRWSEQSGLMPS